MLLLLLQSRERRRSEALRARRRRRSGLWPSGLSFSWRFYSYFAKKPPPARARQWHAHGSHPVSPCTLLFCLNPRRSCCGWVVTNQKSAC